VQTLIRKFPQLVAPSWILVWCCSSHVWRSHWTLFMTNYSL
jgi:hypothetical protein